ncbi:MAG: hypothetical protein ABSG21_02200 [Spirochaetia bacterium]|jgi:Tol biopolymer transport system component
MKKGIIAACVFYFILCSAGYAEEIQERVASEKFIMNIGENVKYFTVSPNNKRISVVYEDEENGKEFVVVDGIEGKRYDKVSSPIFSPDSKRVAYIAYKEDESTIADSKEGKKYKAFAVADDKEGKIYNEIRESYSSYYYVGQGERPLIVFSPDSKRIAYIAKQNGKQFAVINGIEGKKYDEVSTPIFSPNSKRIAYLALQDEREFVIIDNEEVDSIGILGFQTSPPIFSPDSKQYIYIVTFIPSNNGQVVINGKRGKEYDGDVYGRIFPVFSPGGKRMAFAVSREEKRVMIVDGIEGKMYDYVSSPIFSPDGKKVAYIAYTEEGTLIVDGKEKKKYEAVVVVNGKEGKQYDDIGNLIFSPDGNRLAYIAFTEEGNKIVVDDKEGKQYEDLNSLIFSPDSKRVAFNAFKEVGSMIVNGKEEKEYKAFAVVDDKEGEQYHGIGTLVFSPDSKRIAYLAVEEKSAFIIIDDKASKQYDSIAGQTDRQFIFDDSNKLHYLARVSDKYYLIEETIRESDKQ